jgi:hypothetical protein
VIRARAHCERVRVVGEEGRDSVDIEIDSGTGTALVWDKRMLFTCHNEFQGSIGFGDSKDPETK